MKSLPDVLKIFVPSKAFFRKALYDKNDPYGKEKKKDEERDMQPIYIPMNREAKRLMRNQKFRNRIYINGFHTFGNSIIE